MPVNTRLARRGAPLALVGLFALPGCDAAEELLSQPDMAPAEISFEQPLTTPIADLDAAAVGVVCQVFQSTVLRQVPPETRCVPGAIIVAEMSDDPPQAACVEARDTCVRVARLGSGRLPDLPGGPCPFVPVEAEGCDATLETLKPCLDTLADTAVGQIRATLTCALAGSTSVPDVSITVPSRDGVVACAEFSARCPGFFGDGGPDEPGPEQPQPEQPQPGE